MDTDLSNFALPVGKLAYAEGRALDCPAGTLGVCESEAAGTDLAAVESSVCPVVCPMVCPAAGAGTDDATDFDPDGCPRMDEGSLAAGKADDSAAEAMPCLADVVV